MSDELMSGADEAAPVEPGATGETIEWEYRVPLLTSRFMLYDFIKVIILSVLIMYVLVAVMGWFVDGEFVWMPPQVFLIASGAMAGLFTIACLLLGNHVTMQFSVGPDGVGYASGTREKKWNRAAIIVGALAGSATAAGAGLIASSQEEGGWPWAELHRANEYPGPRVITLRNSWRAVLRLHCTPENYEQVRAAVLAGLAKGAAERVTIEAEAPPSVPRPWYSWAAAVVVPVVAAILVTAWPWLQYEDGMRFVVFSALLLIVAGLLGGCLRRWAAAASLVPTAYIAFLTVREMLSTSEGWFPGEIVYGWEYDTALLAITLAGEAMLVGLALWRLFSRERAAAEG
ncbi:MAG: hypothetical protein Q7W51_01715 [Coriobacteriia bacterium]|nr:hypothetical protein [Coriobacteriia bacterium]